VMTGALPDLSIFMLTPLVPERRRGWKEAPGAKAVAEATSAAKVTTLVDMATGWQHGYDFGFYFEKTGPVNPKL
jgi:hypothetical protein